MHLLISRQSLFILVFFTSVVLTATGQQFSGTTFHPGSISGTVTDVNDKIVPGATVTLRKAILEGKSLDELEKWALEKNINPQPRAGRQEEIENLLARLIYSDQL